MVKRSRVSLEDVAAWPNLAEAADRAARGKRDRSAVQDFLAHGERELRHLQDQILAETVPVGDCRQFFVFDPKRRAICAPAFRERVLHQALMAVIGPPLDRTLIDDTYACRIGKGSLAAIHRVQHHVRRFPWYGKLDVRQYFPNIDHRRLMNAVERRFQDERLLALIWRIVDCHHDGPGRGLPIGALTSQHFANFYLSPFDHWLAGQPEVRGLVRYMDDVVWWCDHRASVQAVALRAAEFLQTQLGLEIHQPVGLNRSQFGLTFCGYRIFPGTIKLGPRLKQRYRFARNKWEQQFRRGEAHALRLQQGYASALAITLHADAEAWRRGELQRHPWIDD